MNGQLPGFGGSKDPEESSTELEKEMENATTEEPKTDDEHADVDDLGHTEDITANVWVDPDVEVFTTEVFSAQTASDSTTQDDQIVEVTTEILPNFETTTENDQITTNVPGGPEVEPVVAEFDSDDIVTDVEEGVWNNPDGSDAGNQLDNLLPEIQAVVAEEDSSTDGVNFPPATAASVVEEVEEDAWTDPDDQSDNLLPQIEAVVAETTTSESFTSDSFTTEDSTTELDSFAATTVLADDSAVEVTTEEYFDFIQGIGF